jgi:hypothetical protein
MQKWRVFCSDSFSSNINDRTGQSPVLRLPRQYKIRALSHDRFIMMSLMPEVSAIVTENGREQDITDIIFDVNMSCVVYKIYNKWVHEINV